MPDKKFETFTIQLPSVTDLEEDTYKLYRRLFRFIDDEGYNLYRVWNYIPDIEQNYIQFSEGRKQAFDVVGHHHNIPVATAVSSSNPEQLTVKFYAGVETPIHIDNPLQVPVWEYPKQYGRPLFSRAADVDGVLFIAGTASIIGSDTVWKDNLYMQVVQTISNIKQILIQTEEKTGKKLSLDALVYTVYVRPEYTFDEVRDILKMLFTTRNIRFRHKKMCRQDLLVEIEAVERT